MVHTARSLAKAVIAKKRLRVKTLPQWVAVVSRAISAKMCMMGSLVSDVSSAMCLKTGNYFKAVPATAFNYKIAKG
jgi:hypothetical protein